MKKRVIYILLTIILVCVGVIVASYNDIEPFTTVRTNIENWIKDITGSFLDFKPDGVYTSFFFTNKLAEARFYDSTLDLYDLSAGNTTNTTYIYEIIDGGEIIRLTNVVSQEVVTMSYSYYPEDEIVILDGREYHKENNPDGS